MRSITAIFCSAVSSALPEPSLYDGGVKLADSVGEDTKIRRFNSVNDHAANTIFSHYVNDSATFLFFGGRLMRQPLYFHV